MPWGVLWVSRHSHCIGRGPLTRNFEYRSTVKAQSEIRINHPIISHLTASLWLRGMYLTITSSRSKARGPSNERKNVAEAEKQLKSMGYRLTQEKGRWPFLTPRLENATDKTRKNAPHLIKQVWEFLEGQLEVAETTGMTVGRFVTAANEVTIGGFWREHAKGELKTRTNHEILIFLSPCWEKRYVARVFFAKDTIFEAFVQELLNMPMNLLMALYLVSPSYLFNMGPAYMFSRGVETLRTDGYLTLVLLTHGELVAFHRWSIFWCKIDTWLAKRGTPRREKNGRRRMLASLYWLTCVWPWDLIRWEWSGGLARS